MTTAILESGPVIAARAALRPGGSAVHCHRCPPPNRGAVAIRSALERSYIPPESVDYVIMGQVVTAGAGQNPLRIAAGGAGIPMSVPADQQHGVLVGDGCDRAGG